MGEPRSGEAWRIVSLGHIDHWPTVVQRLVGPTAALPAFAQLKDVGAVILDCIGRIAPDSFVGNTYRKEWLNVDVAATRWRNTRIVVTDPHWGASQLLHRLLLQQLQLHEAGSGGGHSTHSQRQAARGHRKEGQGRPHRPMSGRYCWPCAAAAAPRTPRLFGSRSGCWLTELSNF